MINSVVQEMIANKEKNVPHARYKNSERRGKIIYGDKKSFKNNYSGKGNDMCKKKEVICIVYIFGKAAIIIG